MRTSLKLSPPFTQTEIMASVTAATGFLHTWFRETQFSKKWPNIYLLLALTLKSPGFAVADLSKVSRDNHNTDDFSVNDHHDTSGHIYASCTCIDCRASYYSYGRQRHPHLRQNPGGVRRGFDAVACSYQLVLANH